MSNAFSTTDSRELDELLKMLLGYSANVSEFSTDQFNYILARLSW